MKTLEVVAAVIIDNHKVFATQRGYGIFKDKWEFPGGKVENGEYPEEALIREIKEELDTLIKVEHYLCTVEYDYPEFHLTMHSYICSVIEGSLVLKEHEASKWLGIEDLRGVDWLPADVEVIKAVEKGLLK